MLLNERSMVKNRMYNTILCLFKYIYKYRKMSGRAYTKMSREIYTVLGLSREYTVMDKTDQILIIMEFVFQWGKDRK